MFRFLLKLGVFLLEAFHAAGGIDQFLFAGKIGMAFGTNFNGEIFADGRHRLNLIAAGASDGDNVHFGMDILFHSAAASSIAFWGKQD